MPTYAYACTACDHRFEAQQAFSDDTLTECPECAGRLRKLFNSVGIVFKGSGFYRTDSRGKDTSPSSADAGTKSDSGGASESGAKSDGAAASGGSSSDSGSSVRLRVVEQPVQGVGQRLVERFGVLVRVVGLVRRLVRVVGLVRRLVRLGDPREDGQHVRRLSDPGRTAGLDPSTGPRFVPPSTGIVAYRPSDRSGG